MVVSVAVDCCGSLVVQDAFTEAVTDHSVNPVQGNLERFEQMLKELAHLAEPSLVERFVFVHDGWPPSALLTLTDRLKAAGYGTVHTVNRVTNLWRTLLSITSVELQTDTCVLTSVPRSWQDNTQLWRCRDGRLEFCTRLRIPAHPEEFEFVRMVRALRKTRNVTHWLIHDNPELVKFVQHAVLKCVVVAFPDAVPAGVLLRNALTDAKGERSSVQDYLWLGPEVRVNERAVLDLYHHGVGVPFQWLSEPLKTQRKVVVTLQHDRQEVTLPSGKPSRLLLTMQSDGSAEICFKQGKMKQFCATS